MATAAQQNLDWSTSRALEYFDDGDTKSALASFLSDVSKDRGTAWIQTHPATLMLLQDGLKRGRDAFEAAMRGFNV